MSEDSPTCECFVTPESYWLSAASCGYGSGYEPGSQMEWNPDCPVHLPYEPTGRDRAATARDQRDEEIGA